MSEGRASTPIEFNFKDQGEDNTLIEDKLSKLILTPTAIYIMNLQLNMILTTIKERSIGSKMNLARLRRN